MKQAELKSTVFYKSIDENIYWWLCLCGRKFATRKGGEYECKCGIIHLNMK